MRWLGKTESETANVKPEPRIPEFIGEHDRAAQIGHHCAAMETDVAQRRCVLANVVARLYPVCRGRKRLPWVVYIEDAADRERAAVLTERKRVDTHSLPVEGVPEVTGRVRFRCGAVIGVGREARPPRADRAACGLLEWCGG